MILDESIERLKRLIAEVRQASLTDDKTPLGSALALEQEKRLINEGVSTFKAVVFGDLNDFKQLSDDHSHEAGDVAIDSVGRKIHEIVIEGLQGKAFRKSGDEFVILLRQDLVEDFLSIVSSLGNVGFSHKEKELKTAMSLGYALSDGKRASASCWSERKQLAKTQLLSEAASASSGRKTRD